MPSHASTAPPFPILGDGIHYATPIISAAKTTEAEIVRCVLRMMQGLSSPIFQWDQTAQSFRLATAHTGIYVTHLSFSSLRNLLSQFIYAATCLHLVDGLAGKLKVEPRMPTLRAFGSLVSRRLQRLRDVALKEEMKIFDSSGVGITPTLLGLSSSLSSLCSGAEFLWKIVKGAIPQAYFEPNSCVPAAEMAVHILDYLYVKLDEVCLVQGGEEEAYQTVLHLLVGSLLPFIEGLDSWLFEGALDDPFEEMFFYANGAISVEDSEFWEKSYQLRQASLPNSVKEKDQKNKEFQLCPLFIKDIAKSIVSAGKSLQLIRHVPMSTSVASGQCRDSDSGLRGSSHDNDSSSRRQGIAGLTLSEIFCVSVVGLIGDGDRISGYLQDYLLKSHKFPTLMPGIISKIEKNMAGEAFPTLKCLEKNWYKILADAFPQKVLRLESDLKEVSEFADTKEKCMVISSEDEQPFKGSYCPENPVISVCHTLLNKHSKSWKAVSLSKNFYLPALNDEVLRDAIFGGQEGPCLEIKGTNCAFGFQFGKFEYLRSQEDTKLLEGLFPFPTLLPSFQGDVFMSELLPFQRNSTLSSKVLSWIESVEPSTTPLPVVVRQECLTVYIKQQVDFIGELILSKLMNDWRLMDELAVLRAIFLLGSGDLLQHFLTVIFNRLDKGEPWDDDFELNTILQESICNSADRMLLSAPDSLVVSITKSHNPDGDELPSTPSLASTPHKAHQHSFGIDGLDSLKFMYKVSWPIELIANTEAIKKYNQVMGFLLKVKRAKFVLDKARRWMWKVDPPHYFFAPTLFLCNYCAHQRTCSMGRGSATYSCKHHWLVEQKLLHFVDAFHQYVMDRVYHSAWRELCEGMATAGSLDEVIEVHEAYLLSIQRQCFVVPDKLWALIASRINSILGLALDFYSIQRTLSSGGAASAMKAKCEMEVDRIEKRFDDCIAFLLRVLSFKLNVGHFPHLADLVTRINYNYFYMSDSGNLRTATVPEAATTRLGMAFGSRIE